MKLLKTFLILSLCFLFCQETENDDQKKKSIKDYFKNWELGVNAHIGQVSPITSADRSDYNPGHSLGIGLQAPRPLTIFKQKFIYGISLDFSSLNGNTEITKKINTFSFDLQTKFKKLPLDFKIGFGISDVTIKGISASGTLDIMHKLSNQNDKMDFSIGIRLQQVFDINENYKVTHLHGLYGLNINIGKSIKL